MSFGASGNKPAGLSINTGAANLLGNTSQPPAPGGSLFGNASAGTTKPAGSSLFGTTSNTSSAGTLFGARPSSAAAASSAPSLFGSTTATSAPSQAGTLFGGAAASQPAGGSLFGASTTTSNAPASTSLFGASTANQPAQTGGLFGASTSQPGQTGSLFGASASQPAQAGGSLFGARPAQPAGNSLFGGNAGGGSLFGTNAAGARPANAGSLFGQPAQGQQPQQPQQAGASMSLFGPNASQTARPSLNAPQQIAPQQTQRSIFTASIGQYTASQAVVPGVRIDASNLRSTTRFADLHENLQQELERLDELILKQQKHADECAQVMPAVAHVLSYVPADAEYCQRKLDAMQAALEADAGEIDELKARTRSCADDARVCFRNVTALRAPAHYGGMGGGGVGGGGGSVGAGGPGVSPVPAGLLDAADSAGDKGLGQNLNAYMGRQVDDMAGRLARFRAGLAEVEGYLRGVEANTAARAASAQLRTGHGGVGRRSADDQVRELAAVLREFEAGILGVAGKVGGLREKTQEAMLHDPSSGLGRLSALY